MNPNAQNAMHKEIDSSILTASVKSSIQARDVHFMYRDARLHLLLPAASCFASPAIIVLARTSSTGFLVGGHSIQAGSFSFTQRACIEPTGWPCG